MKPLIFFETPGFKLQLPESALEINIVSIISDMTIKKPLDQINVGDILNWYHQFMNDAPIVDSDIKPNDLIMSEAVEDGVVLRCLSIDGDNLRWETFSGKIGTDKKSLFIKMHRPEDEKVLDFSGSGPKLKDNYAVVVKGFTLDTGDFLVNVKESAFKIGDFISECIYVREIYEGVDYGLVLDIDTGKLKDKMPHLKFEHQRGFGVYVHGLKEGEYPKGSFMSPDVIVEARSKENNDTYYNKLRIFAGSFVPGRVIKKYDHASH